MKLYHYTNLDACTKIVNENGLCFHGTRYDSLNDPTDFTYAEEKILPVFRECLKEQGRENGDDDDAIYPYIVSFSKMEDDFNMWRMYHSEVAIELDAEWIRKSIADKPDVLFKECQYPESEDELHEAFCKLFNETEQCVNDLSLTAREQVIFIKRKEFKNENEFRLCTYDNYLPYTIDGELKDGEIPQDIDFRLRGKDLVLYKKFHIAKCALLGLIVNEPDEKRFRKIERHLRLWLWKLGYSEKLDIRQSESGTKINLRACLNFIQ